MKKKKILSLRRSVLIAAVLFVIVLFFACAVRMPDLSLLQGRDGIVGFMIWKLSW